jgi:hypothetical protein
MASNLLNPLGYGSDDDDDSSDFGSDEAEPGEINKEDSIVFIPDMQKSTKKMSGSGMIPQLA